MVPRATLVPELEHPLIPILVRMVPKENQPEELDEDVEENDSPPVSEIEEVYSGLEPTDGSEVSRDLAKGKALITDTTLMTIQGSFAKGQSVMGESIESSKGKTVSSTNLQNSHIQALVPFLIVQVSCSISDRQKVVAQPHSPQCHYKGCAATPHKCRMPPFSLHHRLEPRIHILLSSYQARLRTSIDYLIHP